jgi:hypothetical protein
MNTLARIIRSTRAFRDGPRTILSDGQTSVLLGACPGCTYGVHWVFTDPTARLPTVGTDDSGRITFWHNLCCDPLDAV